MKKLLLIAAIVTVLAFPGVLLAAGSCTQSAVADAGSRYVLIKFVCTGASDDGSIPATPISAANMKLIQDKTRLLSVMAYPTSGGTAPDAANVTLTMNGQDLLGGAGANLIHATATQDAYPLNTGGDIRFPLITNTVTLGVAAQATVSANYTIEATFGK
jgi:hypothetical protein